jgi:hypothetical protein
MTTKEIQEESSFAMNPGVRSHVEWNRSYTDTLEIFINSRPDCKHNVALKEITILNIVNTQSICTKQLLNANPSLQ